MCNRYAQTSDSARIRLNTIGERQLTLTPRYNVAPTQQVDLLMDGDDVSIGQFDGQKWTWLRGGGGRSRPIRWRRKRDSLHIDSNSHQ
jgi:putative SOS response-associated peptidase YedK